MIARERQTILTHRVNRHELNCVTKTRGEGAMCGEGGTGNRQELEGKRQEGWSDRHIMFEMPDISIISRSITLRAHTVIDHVCK